jgi:signal peptidase I
MTIMPLNKIAHNKWQVCVCLTLVAAFATGCSDIKKYYHRMVGFRAFVMPSGSMEPTLNIGDRFITKTQPYLSDKPRRGDLIVFPFPRDPSKDFIKRLIGLPGEKLEIKDKVVHINGAPLTEPYKAIRTPVVYSATTNPRDNFGPITIPEGSLFVLGDNRDNSFDSRFFGFIPIADVEAKALRIYWAKDTSRIGANLQTE